MKKDDSEQILTKTDIEILHLLSKKKLIPKTELHQNIDKYPNRINDRINNLNKYHFIEEFDGKKRGSKSIKINEKSEIIINLLIKKFFNKKVH